MENPFRGLKKREWILWIASVVIVAVSNAFTRDFHVLTLFTTLIGVSALVFIARGDVWGQILIVIFSVLYAVTSLQYRYYGEAITYLGMSAPIAALSVITWLRNPYEKGKNIVRIHRLTRRQHIALWVLTAVVTAIFYVVLKALHTPNLLFSTISIATSFIAAYLSLYRNSYYALGYAANDLVLIVLWTLASLEDPGYIPVIICFGVFFINDLYGFVSWKVREKKQRIGRAPHERTEQFEAESN